MYYYVAKELLLYETVKLNSVTQRYKSLTSSINIFDKVNKKWTKFEEGTILKAIKLDDVDYLKKKNSCYQLICCQFDAKNRFELAIEFKVVDNFNELIAKDSSNIIDTNSKKKSFYLPVDTVDNSDIDIIPIETCINKHFKLNSLQMIRNFSKLNLNENLIYLKLFSQNIFFNNNNNTKTKNENENNEVKAASIFQLCEFKESCDIICGYLLKEKKFFFAPIKCKLMNSKSIKITKIDDIDTNNELFTNFYNKLNEFKLNADQKIKQFDLELNKLETFHHTDENDVQFNLKKKKPSIKKAKIIHFSDLANIGRSFSSDTLNLKSNDLNNANNNNNNNNSIKNQNNSNNKQQIRFKRNRYYSFKTKEKSKPTNTQQDDEIKPPIIESEMHNLRRSKSVDILN